VLARKREALPAGGASNQQRRWLPLEKAPKRRVVASGLLIFQGTSQARFSFADAYATVGWLCWVPNLLVAEWWIQSTRAARRPVAMGRAAV
jgi:hypothetical protein